MLDLQLETSVGQSNFKKILPSVPNKKNTFIGEKHVSSPAHKDSAKVHSVAVSLVEF